MIDLFVQVTLAFAIWVALLACIVSLFRPGKREEEELQRRYDELHPLAEVIPFPSERPRRPAA